MKFKNLAIVALLFSASFVACDDTTDILGESLTDNLDKLDVHPDTFDVISSSLVADSVYSRNTTGYLGKVKDPETGNYVSCDFMAQFNTLENYRFPVKDSLVYIEGKDTIRLKDVAEGLKDGKILADSCSIRLFYTDFFGDSLATMNLTARELAEPMKEGVKYYSNYNPTQLLRAGGLKVNKTYTLTDLSVSSDERADESSYTPNIKIDLNKPYTDKNNITYNNYGTYIMRKYYENPSYFKNSYNFVNEVCPGFYFEVNEGLGSVAYITVSQLNVYFKYANDTTYVGTASFAGTEEVLQTTNISNDKEALEKLANNDNSCTYLKTPAGIFTELELPIDRILSGHENDTINTAKISLKRVNNSGYNDYTFSCPSALMMIPRDSLYTFFENGDIIDYKKSFYAAYSSTSNDYTFNNFSGMITYLTNAKKQGLAVDPNWLSSHPNWNKVVIIPVSITTNSSGQIVKVVHDMSLTSTKIVKGTPDNPLKLNVIYSKFSE
ncbi:MAG: DUF4270 domain-containing protein [Prevotella sp.]